MSTTRDTSEFHDGSLENPASELTVEKANRILSDSVYEVEKMDSSYRLFRNSGEHVGTYQDVVEMAEDLVELEKGFDGMHGYFQKNEEVIMYGRWSGDNLIKSSEYVDLEEMV